MPGYGELGRTFEVGKPVHTAGAGKTFAKIVLRRQPGLLDAWRWNWRHLGQTLAARRELLRVAHGDPAALEWRIAAHDRRQRAERAERSAGLMRGTEDHALEGDAR